MTLAQVEYGVHNFADSNYDNGDYSETHTILGLNVAYGDFNGAPHSPKEVKKSQTLFRDATQTVLIDALDTRALRTSGGVTEYQQQQAKKEFDNRVAGVDKLTYPTSVLQELSNTLITYALDPRSDMSVDIRLAAADLVTSLGNNPDVDNAKVKRLITEHKKIIKTVASDDSDGLKAREIVAAQMLNGLGIEMHVRNRQSVISDVIEYTTKAVETGKGHAKTVGTVATGLGVAVSVTLAPTAAIASEPASSSPTSQTVNSPNVGNGITVSPAVPTSPEAVPQPTGTLPSPSEQPGSITVNPDASTVSEKASAPQTVPAPAVSNPVEQQPVTQTVIAAPPAPISSTPDSSELPSPTTSNSPTTTEPAPVVPVITAPTPEATTNTSTPEATPLTTDQINANVVTNKLNTDGDINYAASYIAKTAWTDLPTTDQAAVTPVENTALTANLDTLETSYTALLYGNGHADVKYINTTEMAFAVLKAAAVNPAVLQSETVKTLVAGAATPTDAYQARLFAEYAATAKTTLTGPLLAGVTDAPTQARMQEIYAYILMADTTDTAQAASIQTMKDDDAAKAAAAALAAKQAAAAEAAKQAQEQSPATQTPEQEAITNLIANAPTTEKKNEYIAFQAFMNDGYSANSDAGMVGNLDEESASTMDPSKPQDGGGPGEGLAQWEGSRLTAKDQYAASLGKPADDLDTELGFINVEMHGSRKQALAPVMNATTEYDAAYAFMKYYETPDVVIHGTQAKIDAQAKNRADRGQVVLDAFNAEVATVNAARAAAAKAAAEKAAAEAAAETSLTSTITNIVTKNTNPETHKYTGTNFPSHYDAGQCTQGVYIIQMLLGNTSFPNDLGDGGEFVSNLVKDGYAAHTTPQVGDVFSTWTWTSQKNKDGHTGVVTKTYSDGSIDVVQMNRQYNDGYNTQHVSADVVKNQLTFASATK
jgi:surface antigen